MMQQMTLVVPKYCVVQAYNNLSFSCQMPLLPLILKDNTDCC